MRLQTAPVCTIMSELHPFPSQSFGSRNIPASAELHPFPSQSYGSRIIPVSETLRMQARLCSTAYELSCLQEMQPLQGLQEHRTAGTAREVQVPG